MTVRVSPASMADTAPAPWDKRWEISLFIYLVTSFKNSRSGCARSGCFLRLRDLVTEKREAYGVY